MSPILISHKKHKEPRKRKEAIHVKSPTVALRNSLCAFLCFSWLLLIRLSKHAASRARLSCKDTFTRFALASQWHTAHRHLKRLELFVHLRRFGKVRIGQPTVNLGPLLILRREVLFELFEAIDLHRGIFP